MVQSASIRKDFVSGEFITRTFRISGEASLRTDPLLDQLNDHLALFVQLERVFISPLLNPVALTGNYPVGQVRKDNLGLVVLSNWREGLPRREGQYVGRDHIDRKILIMAGGFEVQGVLRLHPSVDLGNFVRTTPEQFILVFEATAAMIANPNVQFEGGAILVNRAQIEVFCIVPRPGTGPLRS